MFGKHDIAGVLNASVRSSLSAAIDLVQQFSLFSGIGGADCAAIISAGHEKRLYRHQNLFSVGDPVAQVFFVLSGGVKMTQMDFRGGEVMLRVCGAGDLVATFGLWQESKCTCAAQSSQPGTALVWDSTDFVKMLDQFIRFRQNTFRFLEERLQELEQRFLELSTEDSSSRLSSELIRLSKKQFRSSANENGGIHLSQTDLARLTGTSSATVNRLLSRWEKLGLVSVRREAILVRDHAALAQFSEVE